MGVMLTELCEDNELIAQSTFFKPKRRKQGAGTHMYFGEKSAGKQSSTIDYLLIDRRWRTCVLNTQATWGASQWRFRTANGVRKDHALLVTRFRLKLQCTFKVVKPYYKALKTAEVAAAAAAAYRQSQEQQQAASTKVLRQMAVPSSDEPDDAVGIDSTATGGSGAVGSLRARKLAALLRSARRAVARRPHQEVS